MQQIVIKKRNLFIICAAALLLCSCSEAESDTDILDAPDIAPYNELDVPMVDGDFMGYAYDYSFCEEPDWFKIHPLSERDALFFAIPDSALSKMTTEGLSHTCMYYPNRHNYLYAENELNYVYNMIKEYNGLQELSKRRYAPHALLKLYSEMDYKTSAAYQPYYSGDIHRLNSFLDFNYLELLLSTDVFIPKMPNKELDQLVEVIVNRTNWFGKHPDLYSYPAGFSCAYSALARVLLVKNERNAIHLSKHEIDFLSYFIYWSGRHLVAEDYEEAHQILTKYVPRIKTPSLSFNQKETSQQSVQ